MYVRIQFATSDREPERANKGHEVAFICEYYLKSCGRKKSTLREKTEGLGHFFLMGKNSKIKQKTLKNQAKGPQKSSKN